MAANLPPLLTSDRIKFNKKSESQKSAFDSLTNLLVKGQSEVAKHEIFDALIAREKLGSTCIGNGVSIPRAQLDITNPRAALLILKKGLEINTVDNKPITFILAILIPRKNHDNYSNILSILNNQLTNGDNLEKLNTIKNPELLIEFFQELLNIGETT